MSGTKIKDVLANTEAAMYNPAAMQDAICDTMFGINSGENYEVLDPNNPVTWSVEASAILAQTSIESHTKTLQRRNAVMAVNMEDLFGHMSDEDWIDPYGQPSRATFGLYIGKEEVLAKAYPRESTGIRKLIIPQDSEFTVAGYTFTLQYPIEIRVLQHGGLQVVYNTDTVSPVATLSSRSLNWSIQTVPFGGKGIDMLCIEIPALQYVITSFADSITKGISWRVNYSFEDNFFYARVWRRVNGKQVELKTTHSDEVIDPMEVTVQLRVLGNELEVYVPDIYVREGMVKGDIRVDIYTTKGAIDVNLGNYSVSEFSARFHDIGNVIDTAYSSPLKKFKHFTLISSSVTRGGRAALTFDEIRSRVIDNSFSGRVLPISEKQLENAVNDLGFDVTKSIDYVTERIYLATGDMPTPSIKSLSTPVGSVNGILETSVKDLVAQDGIKDNGNRITILPKTLYKYQNGLVTVDTRSLTDYQRMTANQLVSIANEETLLYTPFHYVLDINDKIIEERAYYLDNPKVDNKRFVMNNSTLNLDVTTGSQAIEITEDGYKLRVKTRSGETYKSLGDSQKHCQISFTPRGYSEEYAWLNGVLVGYDEGGEAIFEFNIGTTLDIDRNHDMIINNFILVGNSPAPIAMQLSCNMNVVYSVSNYSPAGYRASQIDTILNAPTRDAKGASLEELNINFGKHLPSLWTNARTIAGSIKYRRYDEDVYHVYEADVIKKNPTTGVAEVEFITVDGKPKARMVYEHRKGDFKLDENGDKIVRWKAGYPVIGVDGKPEIIESRSISRRLELFLLDAKFILSTDPETKSYMDEVISTLLGYVTEDLPSIDTSLLEKTNIYFYPKTTMGLIDVLLGDGTTTTFNAENRFYVYYYLTTASRQNSAFLDTLAENTRSAILSNLRGTTVSTSAITEEIRKRLGDEIIDVEMGGMGPYQDQKLFSVMDTRYKPTLGKKLKINPDLTTSIVDDISIGYNSHEVNK